MGKHYQPAADNASAIACTFDLCQMNFMASSVFRDPGECALCRHESLRASSRLCNRAKKSPGPAGALFDIPEKLATGGRRHSTAIAGIIGLGGNIGKRCIGIAPPELFGRYPVGHSCVVTVGSCGRLRCCCSKDGRAEHTENGLSHCCLPLRISVKGCGMRLRSPHVAMVGCSDNLRSSEWTIN
jgi:hypothetical protein